MSRSEDRPVDYSLRRRPLLLALGLSGLAGYTRTQPNGREPQFTSDGWRAEAKLTASDAASGATFGSSVAVSGSHALVGARTDGAEAVDAGAAYGFELDPDAGGWTQGGKVVASDADAGAEFGAAVALDGEEALVGAPASSSVADRPGAAYVFHRRPDGSWPAMADRRLGASDASPRAAFGHAVALDGSHALVGAPDAPPGAVYLFERRADGDWPTTEDAILPPGDDVGRMGLDVALDGPLAVVGGSPVTQFSRRGDGGWAADRTYIAYDVDDTSTGFGWAVAVDGASVLVGAPGDGEAGQQAGAVYFFGPAGARKFLPPQPVPYGHFGLSVALDGTRALVGAPGVEDDGFAGAAYLFDVTTARPTARHRLPRPDPQPNDGYGVSVALDGDWAFVGAPGDDEYGQYAGAVYPYRSPTAETPTATSAPTTTATTAPASPTATRTAGRTTAPSATQPLTEASPPRVAAAGLVGLVTGVAVGLAGDKGVTNLLAILAFLFGGGGVVQLLTGRSDAVAFLAIAVAVGVLVGTLLGHVLRQSGE